MLLLFSGCSEKKMFNQSDQFWYKEILGALSRNDMDSADSSFISLESEHIRSPILKEAILLMAQAYIKREEYLLADYYLDKYLKQFGREEDREYIDFLRIKAKYFSFQNPKRDQKLIDETITLIEKFYIEFPDSSYSSYINSMKSRLYLSKESLNRDIIELYGKLDKPKAVEFYKAKSKTDWYREEDISEPRSFFIKALFE
jgi:outer membrane protein assembly factor BamD